jgi:hypothetical protein
MCANHLHHRCRPSSTIGGPCHSTSQEGEVRVRHAAIVKTMGQR